MPARLAPAIVKFAEPEIVPVKVPLPRVPPFIRMGAAYAALELFAVMVALVLTVIFSPESVRFAPKRRVPPALMMVASESVPEAEPRALALLIWRVPLAMVVVPE